MAGKQCTHERTSATCRALAGRPSPPVRQQPVQQPVQRPPPPAPPAPLVYGQPSQPGSWGSGAQAPFHYPPVYSPQPPFYPHKAPSAPPAPAAQQLPQGGSGRQAAPPSMTPAQQQPRPAAQPPASGSGRTTAQGSGRQPAGTTSAAAAAPPKRRLHPDPSKCAGCGNAVWSSRLNALNRQWHPACFVCGFCSGPINEARSGRGRGQAPFCAERAGRPHGAAPCGVRVPAGRQRALRHRAGGWLAVPHVSARPARVERGTPGRRCSARVRPTSS